MFLIGLDLAKDLPQLWKFQQIYCHTKEIFPAAIVEVCEQMVQHLHFLLLLMVILLDANPLRFF